LSKNLIKDNLLIELIILAMFKRLNMFSRVFPTQHVNGVRYLDIYDRKTVGGSAPSAPLATCNSGNYL